MRGEEWKEGEDGERMGRGWGGKGVRDPSERGNFSEETVLDSPS